MILTLSVLPQSRLLKQGKTEDLKKKRGTNRKVIINLILWACKNVRLNVEGFFIIVDSVQ